MRIFTKKVFPFICLLFVFGFLSSNGFGAIIKSKSTGGSWSVPSTWQGGVVPGAGDDVEITVGSNVTVNTSASCKSITFLQSQHEASSLTLDISVILSVSGDIKINDGNNLTNVLAVGDAKLNVGGSVIIYGNGTRSGSLTVGSGTVNIAGNLEFDGTNGQNVEAKTITVVGAGGAIIASNFINAENGTVSPGSEDNIFIRASYFKTAQDGNWSENAVWLHSMTENGVYYPSWIVPDASAKRIEIVQNHLITLSKNSPASNLIVSGTLDCGSYFVNGPGPFSLNSTATTTASLITAHSQGITKQGTADGAIQVDGLRTYVSKANYTYNGAEHQVTGDGLPSSINGVLTVDKSASTLEVTISQATLARNFVNVKRGKLISNGKLTLESTATSHASIGQMSSEADVVGDVNVQIYITGGTRGARFLSSPINDMNLSEKTFQQLKKFIPVTGPGGVAKGFDKGGLGQPFAITLNLFNEIVGSYVPVSDIHNSIQAGRGFHAFFRGKQGSTEAENFYKLNQPYSIPENVTVTYTGPINKHTLVPIQVTKSQNSNNYYGGYNLIGNPYPSTLDFHQIPKTIIKDQLIQIRPNGTQLSYTQGGLNNNGATQYIQPGQGFYVIANETGEIEFQESFKANRLQVGYLANPKEQFSMVSSSNFIKQDESGYKLLRLNLQDNLNTDETTIAFTEDEKDLTSSILYMSGSTVSLSSMSSDKSYAIRFMPPINEVKEIKLFINCSASGFLKLNFTDLSGAKGYKVLLKDALFPDTLFDVKLSGVYDFNVVKSDYKSYGAGRFSIIFKLEAPTSFIAEEVNSAVQLRWTSYLAKEVESFEVQVSQGNGHYKSIGQVGTGGNTALNAKYSFVDKVPAIGVNYYRLKQTARDGSISFTEQQVVDLSKGFTVSNGKIIVYPNPTTDKINFEFKNGDSNEIEAIVYDTQGRSVKKTVLKASGDLSFDVSEFSTGIYLLELRGNMDKELIGRCKFVIGI